MKTVTLINKILRIMVALPVISLLVGCSVDNNLVPANDTPEITESSINPSVVHAGGQVYLSAVAKDPDQDSLTYTWYNTDKAIIGEGKGLYWTAPLVSGLKAITIEVQDEKGGFTSKTHILTVKEVNLANQNPVIADLNLPDTININQEIVQIFVDANDPDGDPLNFKWTGTGGELTGGSTANWTMPSDPGVYTITVSVNDNNGGTAVVSKQVVVVPDFQNAEPVINSLVASKTSMGSRDTCTITVTASDLDGDALTYNWAPQGGVIDGTGTTVVWTAPDVPPCCGGSFSVSVTADDGKGGVSSKSISLGVY